MTFGIRISFDSLWRAVNRRPAAVTEEGSCLAVTGSSACEAHIHPPDGGVHRDDREGRPLVENLREGIDERGGPPRQRSSRATLRWQRANP